jgi:hypothetical protein
MAKEEATMSQDYPQKGVYIYTYEYHSNHSIILRDIRDSTKNVCRDRSIIEIKVDRVVSR